MAKNKSNFNFNIQPFAGDPATIKFFFLQLEDYVKINNLSEEQALATFRSLLSGNALKYFIEEPSLSSLTTLAEIKEKFIYFFKAEETSSVFALNNIILKPSETIRSLSHRINITFNKVYPNLIDPTAIDTLKFTHLLNALPHDMKVTILKENITTYDKAVERAQQLQNIDLTINSQYQPNEQVQNLNLEITNIKEQLNSIVAKNNQTQSVRHNQRNDFGRKTYQTDFRSRNSYNFRHNPYTQNRNNGSKFCAFCGRYGHLMKFCREFMNISQPTQNRSNFRGKRTFYNQNENRQSLNPNAYPYKPNLN